jgi:hypothetical protein
VKELVTAVLESGALPCVFGGAEVQALAKQEDVEELRDVGSTTTVNNALNVPLLLSADLTKFNIHPTQPPCSGRAGTGTGSGRTPTHGSP